jgi:hypothetical protein
MPQYPLPALDVRTQQSDPLEQVGKVLSLQNMMRQSRFQPQLQAEQLKATQLENTGREQENTVRARQMQDQQAAMAILGKNKGDLDASLPELSQSVSPQTFLGLRKMGLEINKTIAETEKDKLPVVEDQNNRLQGLTQQAQALPPDVYIQQWPQIAAAAKAIKPDLKVDLSQPIPQENLGILGLQFMTLSAAIEKKKAADQAAAAAAALPGIKAESDIKVGQANAMKGGAAVGTGLDVQEANAWLKKNPGKDLSDYAKYKATLVPAFNFNLQSGTGIGQSSADVAKRFGMSPVALDQAAEKYWTTGQLPPIGRGASGPALNKALMNRAAELHPNGSLAANSAEYKANSESLKKFQSQFDAVNAFENTAEKNIDRLLVTAKTIPDLGSRFANTPIRMISEKMIGTEAMARFKADLLTAQNEAAKVLNSANMTGVLSDSARHELQELANGNLSYGALKGAFEEIKNDMGNRKASYQEQIADIKGRLRVTESQPQATGKEVHYKIVNGQLVAQ